MGAGMGEWGTVPRIHPIIICKGRTVEPFYGAINVPNRGNKAVSIAIYHGGSQAELLESEIVEHLPPVTAHLRNSALKLGLLGAVEESR